MFKLTTGLPRNISDYDKAIGKHMKVNHVLKMKEIDEEDSLDSDLYQSSSQNDSELNSISEVDESGESFEEASPSKSLLSNNFLGSKTKSIEIPLKSEGPRTLDARVEDLENDIKFIKNTLGDLTKLIKEKLDKKVNVNKPVQNEDNKSKFATVRNKFE